MPLSKAESAKDDYSGKASAIARQLAFAGIALVWLIRTGKEDTVGVTWDDRLLWPLAAFALTLFFDFMQYVVSAMVWHVFFVHHENRGLKSESLVSAPDWINYPNYVLFGAKVLSVISGFGLLFFHIYWALFPPLVRLG